jgi:hypothetical protein
MTLQLTNKVTLQLRRGNSLLGYFRGHTHRLTMISVTFLFVEIGLLKKRRWLDWLPE